VRTHKSLSLIAAGAMLAAGAAFVAGPAAMADPINAHGKEHAVVPAYYDVVGVGADTDDTLFDQLSFDYDAAHKTHNKNNPYIYSWDATPPNNPLSTSSLISPKKGCAKIGRPDGSGAGLTAFELGTKTKGHYCIDFGREASYRSSDPDPYGKDLYVALAEDAETYAVSATTNAPASLTIAQLKEIYQCEVPATGAETATNNWADLGGKDATIDAAAPAATTGVGKFWLKALGISTFGTCVTTVQQNQGLTSVFGSSSAPNPNVIVPFSVGKYIAQRYHSAAVGKNPGKNQNKFGRNEVGHLVLGKVGGVAATTGTGVHTIINKKLDSVGGTNLTRSIYDLVWFAKGNASSDHDGIPTYLERFFAPASRVKVKGWFCGNKEAQQAIVDYGFLKTLECGLGT
jgi:ABC-type phosphate transport system substrate-binding protein